jgi:predicted transcriptional regulator
MSTAVEKAVEALESLPEELRESAIDYLLLRTRRFQSLKEAIDEGLEDVTAGRVVPWELDEFLKQARSQAQ